MKCRLLTAALAASLPFASLSAEPLRISDNPVKACSNFLAMSERDQQLFGAGFFVAVSRSEPLVWYAVIVHRTFADSLKEYCERHQSESPQSVANKTAWTIWYRAPEPAANIRHGREHSVASSPIQCDTCE
jgi:hypothetical protein